MRVRVDRHERRGNGVGRCERKGIRCERRPTTRPVGDGGRQEHEAWVWAVATASRYSKADCCLNQGGIRESKGSGLPMFGAREVLE